MAIDPTRLAAATGLIDRQARAAQAQSAAQPQDINGVTSLKKDGEATDVFGLGKDDFFKLFLAQLKNQDPTQPMDDKEFLAQLAQFTMIDTLEQVKTSLAGTQLAQASALIGDQVIGIDTSGLPANGIVDRIVQDSTGIMLVLEGGQLVEPSMVTQVLSGKDAASTATT
jgi:flagellar basal-body rod modification protein FlgD